MTGIEPAPPAWKAGLSLQVRRHNRRSAAQRLRAKAHRGARRFAAGGAGRWAGQSGCAGSECDRLPRLDTGILCDVNDPDVRGEVSTRLPARAEVEGLEAGLLFTARSAGLTWAQVAQAMGSGPPGMPAALHPTDGTTGQRLVSHTSPPDLLVLHAVRIKGFADTAAIAHRLVRPRPGRDRGAPTRRPGARMDHADRLRRHRRMVVDRTRPCRERAPTRR